MGSVPYGVEYSSMYALYGILLSFAVHGWYCTFADQERQLQSYDPKGAKLPAGERKGYAEKAQPRAAAVRTIATFATSLVYTVFPFAPQTDTWAAFAAWTCALAVYWDLHFFFVHGFAHENRHAYKWLHKLHHLYKQPDVFSAYFVTYQSHFFTEQSVILIAAMAGLPVDVFTWTLWFGTLDSFIKHAGHSVSSCKLPFLPISWETFATALSPWSLVLGGATTAEHDWHHEKFTTNYSLSFTYLDKLLGKYHPGRVPGEALKDPESVKSVTGKTAMYTNLIESTSEDWRVQGAAFDKYKADGHVVRNILALVENMKGELGEVGARVDMYEHCLQSATRARRAGADTETIVCALLHDIGEVLSGTNHGEIAAAVLRPYITPLNHWMLSNHEVFQAHYFLDKCGGDKDLRDKAYEYTSMGYVKGHPYYEATERFCLEYDQPSFDPDYDTDTLASFVPLVKEVLDRTPFWWEPEGKPEDKLDCKARLAFGYSLDARSCGKAEAAAA
jgi:predicted HD phosphohydrolase/sterol desaturase/sphingolipid hydroxylase (fatty acid hydroxylase superfamily)